MKAISVAVATTKFLFDTCNCTVDSGVCKGDFSLVPGDFARAWTGTRAIASVSGHGLYLSKQYTENGYKFG